MHLVTLQHQWRQERRWMRCVVEVNLYHRQYSIRSELWKWNTTSVVRILTGLTLVSYKTVSHNLALLMRLFVCFKVLLHFFFFLVCLKVGVKVRENFHKAPYIHSLKINLLNECSPMLDLLSCSTTCNLIGQEVTKRSLLCTLFQKCCMVTSELFKSGYASLSLC